MVLSQVPPIYDCLQTWAHTTCPPVDEMVKLLVSISMGCGGTPLCVSFLIKRCVSVVSLYLRAVEGHMSISDCVRSQVTAKLLQVSIQ